MMLSEIKPMIVPVTTPDRTKTGKYTNIFILLIIRAAVRICPKLCATPPEILTPSILPCCSVHHHNQIILRVSSGELFQKHPHSSDADFRQNQRKQSSILRADGSINIKVFANQVGRN